MPLVPGWSPGQSSRCRCANGTHLSPLQMLTEGCLRGNTNPTPYFLSMVACGGRLIIVGVPWPRPPSGIASVVQCTLQGQEEADASETTSLPAFLLFLFLLSHPSLASPHASPPWVTCWRISVSGLTSWESRQKHVLSKRPGKDDV